MYYNNLNNICVARSEHLLTDSFCTTKHTHKRTWGGWTHSFLPLFFLVSFLPVFSLSTTFLNGQRLFSGVSITTISGYSKHRRRITPQRIFPTHLLAESKLFSSTTDKLALLVYIYIIYNKSFSRSNWYFLSI